MDGPGTDWLRPSVSALGKLRVDGDPPGSNWWAGCRDLRGRADTAPHAIVVTTDTGAG